MYEMEELYELNIIVKLLTMQPELNAEQSKYGWCNIKI